MELFGGEGVRVGEEPDNECRKSKGSEGEKGQIALTVI